MFSLRKYSSLNKGNKHINVHVGIFHQINYYLHSFELKESEQKEESAYQIYPSNPYETFYKLPLGNAIFVYSRMGKGKELKYHGCTNSNDDYLYFCLHSEQSCFIYVVIAPTQLDALDIIKKHEEN